MKKDINHVNSNQRKAGLAVLTNLTQRQLKKKKTYYE